MTTEEIALRILCSYIQSGIAGSISVREAFAMAVRFEEQAKEVRAGRRDLVPVASEKLSFDDNGL